MQSVATILPPRNKDDTNSKQINVAKAYQQVKFTTPKKTLQAISPSGSLKPSPILKQHASLKSDYNDFVTPNDKSSTQSNIEKSTTQSDTDVKTLLNPYSPNKPKTDDRFDESNEQEANKAM